MAAAKKSPTGKKNRYVIIMAGGKGERFWPLSREATPKQLLAITEKRSFLQQAVDRVLPLAPIENILIITNLAQAPTVAKQLPKLPKANIIAEPCGRDTCAAITLGAALVGARSKSAVMAVLPADHVIPDEKKFQQILGDCFNLAAGGTSIVTIGIKPTEPATGYGYIRGGRKLPARRGEAKPKTTFHKAEQFVEKPHFDKAVEYLESGNYRWNAGMFIWSFDTISQVLAHQQPEFSQACARWMEAAASPAKLKRVLAREYPEIRKISVDFAIMEQAPDVVVASGDFSWDDLGSWTAVSRHLPLDGQGNCAVGDFVHVDSAGNIVFDARTRNRTPITLVGVQDCILVQTDDAVMLANKHEAQKVKQLVTLLGHEERFKHLL